MPATRRPSTTSSLARPRPGDVVAGIRPEDLREERARSASASLTERLAAEVIVHFELARENGDTARVPPRGAARPGGRLRLAPATQKLHFFDPETGATLAAS